MSTQSYARRRRRARVHLKIIATCLKDIVQRFKTGYSLQNEGHITNALNKRMWIYTVYVWPRKYSCAFYILYIWSDESSLKCLSLHRSYGELKWQRSMHVSTPNYPVVSTPNTTSLFLIERFITEITQSIIPFIEHPICCLPGHPRVWFYKLIETYSGEDWYSSLSITWWKQLSFSRYL